MCEDYIQTEEFLLEDFEQGYYLASYRWLKWLLLIFAIGMPAVIALKVASDRIATCFLAYFNCVFIGFGLWRFLRKGSIAAMVPFLFAPILLLGWPVAILYFAIFYPAAHYGTLTGYVSYFDAGVKLQLSVALFFAGYYLIIFRALRNERPSEGVEVLHPRRFANITTILGLSIITSNAVSMVVKFPGVLDYLVEGLFHYLNSLLFIAGALIKDISKVVKILMFSVLTVAVLFFTAGNARGIAIFCVLMLFFGMLFFSKMKRKTKLILAVSLIFAFPIYLVVGNTTRILLGTIGYEEGFGYRLQVLKEWRSITKERPEVFATFGRLFFTGGHVIISQTPSRVPYRHFSPARYPKEMLEALILQRFYYKPYYRGSLMLLNYGMCIIPGKTSIGVSLLGSFWILGGYPFMFLGGIAIGLLHSLFIVIL